MDIHQENMEAAMFSSQSELEMTKNRVEDVPLRVDQKTQGLRKELKELTGQKDVRQYVDQEPPGHHNSQGSTFTKSSAS
jgi:hypothetical protein